MLVRIPKFAPCFRSNAGAHNEDQTIKIMESASYEDAYVQCLFDRMGPTYDLVNLVSSLGFSEFWRRRCIRDAGIQAGSLVCDMMAGSGECWRYIQNHGASLISIDFSQVMADRQRKRSQKAGGKVDVRCENASHTSIESGSIDYVVSGFGLKTLNHEALERFAREIARVLKPGGRFSLLEISTAEGWLFAPVYRWYVNAVIPLIGKLCLGDIECYRMLGAYVSAFGSCDRIANIFAAAGLEVSVTRHFYGCATSLVGKRPE